jgi:hypothetical protein
LDNPLRDPQIASVHQVARATRQAAYRAFCEGVMKPNEATAKLLATSLMERRMQRPAQSGDVSG